MAQKKKVTKKYTYSIGRRKKAVATVRLFQGKGDDLINGKKAKQVYKEKNSKKDLYLPFEVTETDGKYYFTAKVRGGGISSQKDAVKLALSRALVQVEDKYRKSLKQEGLLTRDDREKERKKPGLKKARKKEQYSKR